jgi:hypothetical protein
MSANNPVDSANSTDYSLIKFKYFTSFDRRHCISPMGQHRPFRPQNPTSAIPPKRTLPTSRIQLEARGRRPLPLPRFGLNSLTAFCQATISSSNQTRLFGEM